jgi:Cytochrome P460
LLLGLSGLLVYGTLSAGALPPGATRPTYTKEGELQFPAGYRTWVFVGADLSPEYKKDTPADKTKTPSPAPAGDGKSDAKSNRLHNVYINREAYESFIQKGEFPDPTMLVLEVFRAERKDPKGILSDGLVETERVGLSVAVKDSHRPGGGVPWAYYTFNIRDNPKPVRPVAAHVDEECYACHLQHASKDNVWVQFYPALRDPE